MHTITIRIMWNDLSEQMQNTLLKVFGDNNNWDCIPMSIVEINNDDDLSRYPGKDIVIDSFLGNEGLDQ